MSRIISLFSSALLALSCSSAPEKAMDEALVSEAEKKTPEFSEQRAGLVQSLRKKGIRSDEVLRAMARVPRHRFISQDLARFAYIDEPLSIGMEQTISQPYIVAYMTEALRLQPSDRVLEIGTGSGYQAAVLAELVKEVYSIEIIPELGRFGAKNLADTGYRNVEVRIGDGYAGWPEKAPFEAIIVTAAPDHIPPRLVEQLAVGGRMILPVGSYAQELILVTKTEKGVVSKKTLPVRFVPMTGEAQRK